MNRKSNADLVKEVIKAEAEPVKDGKTEHEPVVIGVSSELIHFTQTLTKDGRINPSMAIVLAQIIYLSDKGSRQDGYIFKTYDEMFDLVGVKENTLRSYYNAFEEKGFLDLKVKKANGSPTLHFRLDVGRFVFLFRKFLQNRNLKKQGNETLNTEETLTKNTYKNISNIGRGAENFPEEKFPTLDELRENQKEDSGFSPMSDGSCSQNQENWDLVCPADFMEVATTLPPKFKPSMENQFWAVTNFPTKSPKLVTENFIAHFTDEAKSQTYTPSNWQQRWRKWVIDSYEPKGLDAQLFDEEKLKIKDKVGWAVYEIACDIAFRSQNALIPRDVLYNILCREGFSFSKETVQICLEELVNKGYLGGFFQKSYYYITKVKIDGKYQDDCDYAGIYLGWNQINDNLKTYIQDNYLVNRDELIKNVLPNAQDFVDAYLKGGAELDDRWNNLIELNGYYYNREMYDESDEYQKRVDAKLAQLRIPNSHTRPKYVEDTEWEEEQVRNMEECNKRIAADSQLAAAFGVS